ncbi:MAG: hypothetical protein C0594_14995 [Marinilabiliales bacterium]|nr:MAG: hypothetical protein C0594_14995 [Marinilabiliales bacterium]
MGSAAADENICITGAQDNGTMKYNAGVWNAVIGGDGMECFIDENNSSTMYGTVYYGALYKSTNGGYDFNEITPLAAEDGAWVTPFATEPGNSNVIYGGYTDVFKTSDAGNSWTQISTDLTGGTTLRSLAVAPSNTDVIYAATYTSIWKTTDGGTTWSDISSGFPVLSIKYITVSDTDPGNIWVSLSGYTAGEKVYTSTDGGNSWSNFSDGLPNLPVNCVLYENESNDAIYAGTDVGVYYRNESMSAWELFSEGLPNVIVNELEIHYASGKIRAATFGRGLWESDLYTSSSALELSFVVSDGICNGDCAGEIDLTVSGGAEPYSFLWSNGATTEDVINMCAGSYTVTVTDATDQDIVGDIQVDEPSVLMLGFTNVQNETSLDACDGALQVTAVGGIQPYGYLWSNGETTTDIIDLCPDMYIVTVTDYNGCTMVDSMAVDSSQSLFEVELLNMGLIDCYGDSTASLQITAHGDHPHTYSWSNGQNDSIIENLPAGVYTVTVIDVDLDTVISSYEIIQPDSILIELVMFSNESESGNCDGSIAVDATGGSGIDQYQWSNGGNGETIDNLCSGEYELTVTDYNMCTNTTSFIITTGSVFSVDALITGGMVCQGECTSELAALPLNGTAPYSYLWSNGATDSVIANLCAGTYYLTVTDSTMVVAVDSAVIETSDILSISLDTLQHVSCLGCCDGQIAIDPDAQSGSISLLWSNGETNDTISDLCPGDYSVTLTSISGCSVDTVFTVIDPFVFNAQVDSLWQPTCYGLCDAGILVEATGGTPPYTYLWSTGATDSLVENLCSGEYYVTVQDLDSTMVIGIEIFEASPLNAEISGGLFLCDNNNLFATNPINILFLLTSFSLSYLKIELITCSGLILCLA